ncbi:MAG: hypothetical protein AAF639_31390 [Chloroflexota bacterium]
MSERNKRCKGQTILGEQCKRTPGASGYCSDHDPEKKRLQEEEEARLQNQEKLRQQKLQSQIVEIENVIKSLENKFIQEQNNYETYNLLISVVDGLYVEIEKLTKKAPAEQITTLALQQVNDVINDTKEFMHHDKYIQKLPPFVPAGDNPEYRDVLVILRQIKQGLERFHTSYTTNPSIDKKLAEANTLKFVLEKRKDGTTYEGIYRIVKKDRKLSIPDEWVQKVGHNDFRVDFDYIDSLAITDYFG